MWKKLISLLKSDNLLDQAWRESFDMLKIDHEMFLEAVRILRESDSADLSEEIMAKDEAVDAYEQDVRKKVLTHCAVQGAPGISAGMALITIVIDIERIGDYVKNIAYLAKNHPARLQGGAIENSLKHLEDAVKKNFIDTRTCIESSDADAARKILQEYESVKTLCDNLLESLIHEKDPNLSSGEAVSLALYIRWLRRINSHLHNLNTSVVNPFDRIGFKPSAM